MANQHTKKRAAALGAILQEFASGIRAVDFAVNSLRLRLEV